jgi:F-type H+-transporting ATPase subunit alpha
MSDDTVQALGEAVDAFKKQFQTADGKLLGED